MSEAMEKLKALVQRLGVTPMGWLAYGLALLVIVADQLSKTFALNAFVRHCPGMSPHVPALGQPMVECSIPVSRIFSLTLVWNGGMSFGLFRGGADLSRWALALFAVIVAGALGWWARKADKRLFALAAGCLIGGAIGNVIDRFRFGAVVDFLDFKGLTGGLFPWIFNVADSAITVGAIALIVEAFAPSFRSWLASRMESGN
jgi:signal peptidase II